MARKHGFFRPHVAGLSGIYSTTLREGGGDIITSIFADGTDGFYHNFAKLSKLWQNTAGSTPVAAAGDNIARVDDSSPRGRNGTQATTSAQPKWQTGGLARFDGSDDNLLTTLAPGTAMTLMVKPKVAISGSPRVFLGCDGGGGTGRMFIAQTGAGLISGGVGLQSTTIIYGGGDVQGATGAAALTCDGSTVRLYWRGTEIYSGAQSGAVNTTIPVAVGCNNSNGTLSTFSNADIYYALAIKKALTAAQIAAITNKWGTS